MPAKYEGSTQADISKADFETSIESKIAFSIPYDIKAAANAAKYLAGEAGFNACQQAVMTHGGFGYAKEFHVERFLREVMIARIAPVSEQLILCYVAERVLGLPKSY